MSLESKPEVESVFKPWIAQLYFESRLDEQAQPQALPIFANEELKIGRLRDKDCTYTINHDMVSKQHLRIYSIIYDIDPESLAAEVPKPPLVFCEDLESSNGTYVNGELIGIHRKKAESTAYLLTDGDVIEIKPFWKFTFSQPDTRDKQGPDRSLIVNLELKLIQADYAVSNRCLGSGTYGAVYLAKDAATRKQFACKIIETERWQKAFAATKSIRGEIISHRQTRHQMQERAMREIKILSKLSHPNIIELKQAFVSEDAIYMFLDLASGGDLFEYIRQNGGLLSDVHCRVIIRQLAFAVEFIHSKGVVHRDIKPENVLLGRRDIGWRVILADFGLAIDAQDKLSRMESVVGTRGYTAPEVTCRNTANGYTMAADIFSFGLVTLLALTGTTTVPEPGYTQKNNDEIASTFHDQDRVYAQLKWKDVSSSGRKFIRRLLDPVPQNRIRASQAVKHQWFMNPRGHSPKEADNVYQRSIQNWEGRKPNVKVIKELPGHKMMRHVSKSRSNKLPDATASPYFGLDHHLDSRTPSSRRKILKEIAQTGQPFITDSLNEIWAFNQNVKFPSRSVDGNDLFDTVSEAQAQNLEPKSQTPSSRKRRRSLAPERKDSNPVSNSQNSDLTPSQRMNSSDAEDQELHDTVAQDLPLLCSAKDFKNAIVKGRGRKRTRN